VDKTKVHNFSEKNHLAPFFPSKHFSLYQKRRTYMNKGKARKHEDALQEIHSKMKDRPPSMKRQKN